MYQMKIELVEALTNFEYLDMAQAYLWSENQGNKHNTNIIDTIKQT